MFQPLRTGFNKYQACNGLTILVSVIITMPVVYEGQEQCLVVQCNGPALLDRNWLEKAEYLSPESY